MDAPNRPPPDNLSILEDLEAAPHAYHPFEALRRLECHFRDHPRLGTSGVRPQNEPIRLRQVPSLRFEPSSLVGFTPPSENKPGTVQQSFFGLFGPNGPLPLHLTGYALDRRTNAKDQTLERFADIFHHRLLALFYRAWAQPRPTVQADRPGEDRFRFYLGALFGRGQSRQIDVDQMPHDAKLYFAARLLSAARGPEGLEAMIAFYFQIPVRLEEYAGEWLPLGSAVTLRLGTMQGARLGLDAIIGEVAWTSNHRFRIVLGPLSAEQFAAFLPVGKRLGPLAAIIRNYSGDELDWQLKLRLRAQEVPPTRLGKTSSSRLGWNSWLQPDQRTEGVVTIPAGACAATNTINP
jgi:type VI secretion system protein ImpH